MAWPKRMWLLVLTLAAIGLVACVGQASSFSSTSAQVTPYPTLNPAQVARGQQIYIVHCASCHGPNGQGAPGWATPGPDGLILPPAHDDNGHTWHHPDRVLYEVVRDGMRDPLKPDSPLHMPAFGHKLSDAERRAVIEYLKSLWSPRNRQYQFDETSKDFAPTPTPAP